MVYPKPQPEPAPQAQNIWENTKTTPATSNANWWRCLSSPSWSRVRSFSWQRRATRCPPHNPCVRALRQQKT